MDRNEFMMQTPVKKNAAYYRERARGVLKGHYWMTVLVTLIASLLGGVAVSLTFSFGDVKEFREEVKGEEMSESLQTMLRLLSDGDVGGLFDAYPILPILLIGVGTALVSSLLFHILVGGPVALGYQKYHLDLHDGKPVGVKNLFDYFHINYGQAVLARALYDLLMLVILLPVTVCSLWLFFSMAPIAYHALLENADGVMQALRDALLPFFVTLTVAILTVIVQIPIQFRYFYVTVILAEYPEIGAVNAFRNSANLMRGNKWKLFCLQFSFFGWIILAAICPFGFDLLTPYMQVANTAFYDDIANRSAAKEAEFPSLNPDDYNPDEAKW